MKESEFTKAAKARGCLAYAHGTIRAQTPEEQRKGVLPADWVVSVDKHLGFVYHIYATQVYQDNGQFSETSYWYLNGKKCAAFFDNLVRTLGLQIDFMGGLASK